MLQKSRIWLKRYVSFCLALLILISSINLYPVKVDAAADNAAFKSALETFLGTRNLQATESALFKWSTVISYLKADGMNEYAIAAFMGCWIYEAGNALYAVEGHGGKTTTDGKYYTDFVAGGVYAYARDCYPPHSPKTNSSGQHVGSGGNGLGGVAQWTWGREDNLTNFCGSGVDDGCKLPSECGFVTVSHNEYREQIPRWDYDANGNVKPYWVYKTHKIPDLPGQMMFVLHELKHISYYTNGCYNKLKNVTSATEATKYVFTWYEGGGSDYTGSGFTNRAAAAEKAVAAVRAFTGVTGSAPGGGSSGGWGTPEGDRAVAAGLVDMGIWGTAQLSTYCSLTETNYEETLLLVANKSNLTQQDLESLTDWSRNKQMKDEEHGYIAILRYCVVLLGILLTIWAVLVYIAFWFDHINSFIYLDVLHILTFGQLHICPPGDKPTFSVKEKVKVRTVSHRQIIFVCATAILFGVMLISGVFYMIVQRFVNLIVGLLR